MIVTISNNKLEYFFKDILKTNSWEPSAALPRFLIIIVTPAVYSRLVVNYDLAIFLYKSELTYNLTTS